MEQKFLLYLLYISFVDIRERSYNQNDKATFWLADLLHNVPLQLGSEEGSKEAYESLVEKITTTNMDDWFLKRKEEFINRYPEFRGKF